MRSTGLALLGAVMAAGSVYAAEYTVTRAGSSIDLTALSTYTADYPDIQAVPGPEDTVIVDMGSTTDATVFTIDNDLALRGLCITNSNGDITFGVENASPHTLTIGADGFRVARPEGKITTYPTFTGYMPFATSAATVFHYGWMKTSLYATITGTEDLTFTGCRYCYFYALPNYNGYMYCHKNGHFRLYSLDGKWANRVKLVREGTGANENDGTSLRDGDVVEFDTFGVDATAAALFPQGVELSEYNVRARNFNSFTFADGDNWYCSHGVYLDAYDAQNRFSGFRMDITGGNMYNNENFMIEGNCEVTLGISGGTITNNYFYAGHNMGGNKYMYRQAVEQTGGDMWVRRLFVGHHCRWENRNEYVLGGGTLNTLIYNGDDGVVLSLPDDGYGGSGRFIMTNGTLNCGRLALSFPSRRENRSNNGYARFEMSGGTFNLGAYGIVSGYWNTYDSEFRKGGHRLQFNGGTLAVAQTTASEVPMYFNGTGEGVTLDIAQGANFAIKAPFRGHGRIVKDGPGNLIASDGVGFTGDIEVKEGTLFMQGSNVGSTYIWRVDDSVPAGAVGGESITVLDDANECAQIYNTGNSVDGKTVPPPTLELDAFNGHAALAFNKNALYCPREYSPAAGETEWSVVVVFKTSSPATDHVGDERWYSNNGICGWEEGGTMFDWGLSFGGTGGEYVCGGVGFQGFADRALYSDSQYPLADGNPHVAIYTVNGGVMTVAVDGVSVSRDTGYTGGASHNNTPMVIGYQARGDIPNTRPFVGSIAEIRSYKGHALSASEIASVTTELAARYGAVNRGADAEATVSGYPAYTAPSYPYPEVGVYWKADTLKDGNDDGAEITNWVSVAGGKRALRKLDGATRGNLNANGHGPKLVKDAVNGHSVLRFDNSGTANSSEFYRQALAVPNEDLPFSSDNDWDFTAAIVFRADTSSDNTSGAEFWNGWGLLNCERGGYAVGDWGLSVKKFGRIAAGTGGVRSGGGDGADIMSNAGDLCDGKPHVVIYACKYNPGESKGEHYIMVDGLAARGTFDAPARENLRSRALDLCVGCINDENNKFFKGDIAAFMLCGEYLPYEQVKAISDAYCADYGIEPVCLETGFPENRVYGLSARSIQVDSGATFRLVPCNVNPFTLSAGSVLSGAGSVSGTLAVGPEAVLDATDGLSVEYLQALDGSTLRLPTAGTMSVTSFSASGEVTIELPANTDVSAGITVISAEPGGVSVADGTVFTVTGATSSARVSYSQDLGTVTVRSNSGVMIILR